MLGSLTSFDVSSNRLTGERRFALVRLVCVILYNCATGTLSSSFAQLSALVYIGVVSNLLSGLILYYCVECIDDDIHSAEGILPSQLCGMTSLSSLSIWNSSGSSTNPAITCTRSCLSSLTGMSFMSSLPECPMTAISTGTQRGLCALIASTNVASLSEYSSWACNAFGQVSTQPCNGGSNVWPAMDCNDTTGDVSAIYVTGVGLTGRH